MSKIGIIDRTNKKVNYSQEVEKHWFRTGFLNLK
uniref:Uncharacterized protein n=1 Tax=Lepeophtheirus salmonis TaxID=72036 RepID=A0A0K2TEK2_LEPSM